VLILELACTALILMYLVACLRRVDDRARLLRRLGLLVVAAWLTEDTVIHAYGFYAYSPRWSVFVDRVPLMVILIWPMVIHSSWRLARCLLTPAGERAESPSVIARAPLVGAAMVFADAWLIEPVSVEAGLWWWTHPGLFAVPPIGVLGWALFAGLAMAVLGRARSAWQELLVLVIAPIGTHLLLLATWWGLFRWVEGTIPPAPAIGLVWLFSLALFVTALRRRVMHKMPLGELMLRIPAAMFFFVLLGIHGRDVPTLVAWVIAFAPPYCAITPWPQIRRLWASHPTRTTDDG